MHLKGFNMGQTATLTKTGQITVPKWVREYLGVSSGDTIVFKRERGGMKIMREKTAEEIAAEIDKLIPDEARKWHMCILLEREADKSII